MKHFYTEKASHANCAIQYTVVKLTYHCKSRTDHDANITDTEVPKATDLNIQSRLLPQNPNHKP